MTSISKDIFKKIRQIEFKSTRLANDLLAGAYHSAFKGKGMEFEEVREYIPGDEIRSIDWNVTARMHHPYVKLFREERELTLMLVVDISASSRFGTVTQLKSDLITEVGAVIAFSAMKNQDKVGLILFTDEVELYIPPKKGLRHVLRLVRELLVFQPKHSGTDIGKALAYLGKVQRRSGICFLISDFLAEGFEHEMALTAKSYDLIATAITDPGEFFLPNLNLAEVGDPETGKTFLADTSPETVRKNYQKMMEEKHHHLRQFVKRVGADLITLRTDRPYLAPLRHFFKIRERRR